MSLPSPFAFLDWDESSLSLIVAATTDGKKWGLISVDGVSTETIIQAAKKESLSSGNGSNWLHNFATMFPNYCLMASTQQADSFVITGEAHVELEDLDSHEIEEHTFPASEEAYEAAVAAWKHDACSDEAIAAAEKSAAQTKQNSKKHDTDNDDDEYEDVDTEDGEGEGDDDDEATEKKHHLEVVAQMLDAANATAATALRLTPKMMREAFQAAGGQLASDEEELSYLSQSENQVIASFIQEMVGGHDPRMGGQECHQQ
mmetsp:Transcript_43118/g.49975  ORF Transcript_43118/g.49975 Transcript_43118/m.49975 type:complete len:259 (-) Transcript_43118:24-800(-)